MDHLRQIPQVGRAWEDIPEVYTALAFLAGVTEKIRLGALVTAITHRHPAVLGKAIATLDVLSGGRANLGLGLGWDSKEHQGYGIDFPDTKARYALLEDTLELLPLLWGKGSPRFEGRTIRATELACYPRPIQERIPITIGGSGEIKTLRIVARHGDGCNLFGEPEVIRRKLTALHRHCAEIGRDPGEIEVTHLVNAMTASDRVQLRDRIELLRPRNLSAEEFAARHKAGTVDDQIAHLDAYGAVGVTHSIVVLPDLHLEGSIEAFGEVITRLSGT
jgi:alkanesulfonate monooxygenase SsuD/methylene tetrahydromethanopterin reductase-like flavin-dependent oxidoreductase (luciferase family)